MVRLGCCRLEQVDGVDRLEHGPGRQLSGQSDVRAPLLLAIEVFRAAKNLNNETPVILMTGFGYDPHHSIVRSSQEGLHCFLFKPFQIEQLLEEVYKALVIDPREG